MKVFKIVLALSLCLHLALSFFDVNMSEREFDRTLESGSMDGYLTFDEFYKLLTEIRKDSQNARYISGDQVFGKTYEGRQLSGFYICDDTSQLDRYLSHKNILLINAVHHSREPLTLTMILLMTRELLKDIRLRAHSKIKEFLRDNVIFLIPVVNVDSYLYINNHYHDNRAAVSGVRMIRKNRHIHPDCNEITGGVDLNRNYDFQFGINDTGSSSHPCDEDYRGPRAFSEPETASVKKYVDDHSNIVSAINIHTYGNSWIYPFNFVSDKTDHYLQTKKRLFYDFYKNFEADIKQRHIKALFGNAAFTLDYPTNGEAGDWFTGKKNILNIDVELGNTNPASEQFYPPKSIIADIVRYNWMVMKEFLYRHIIELSHRVIYTGCEVVFEIRNDAISSLIDFEGILSPDLPAGVSEYKLFYALKELPESPATKIPVIEKKVATTLKGRHILAIYIHFSNDVDAQKLAGLTLEITRNSSFLHYKNQTYHFRAHSN